jgi:hydrogenase maturation protease
MEKNILIIGLGNTILSDDGAGILTAQEIAKQCHALQGIDIVEASLGGIGLLDLMAGYERVIIVDSIKTAEGQPGEIYKIDIEDLGDIAYPSGPHFLDLRTAVELGKKLGYEMPDSIEIYAIEIKDNTTFTETLTPEVENAIPALVSQIIIDQGLIK